ncbi:hypothetical protein Q9L58_008169 [Maublancomyces gigas]|uniref:Uncharacterized protein n=1 Tax=Discina gigas TaxID=1032678 RepID=A0ABR3GAG5_9PEZI
MSIGKLIGNRDKPGVPWVLEERNFDDGRRFEVTVREETGNDGVVDQSNRIQGLILESVGEERKGVNDESGHCHQNLVLKASTKVPWNSHYY